MELFAIKESHASFAFTGYHIHSIKKKPDHPKHTNFLDCYQYSSYHDASKSTTILAVQDSHLKGEEGSHQMNHLVSHVVGVDHGEDGFHVVQEADHHHTFLLTSLDQGDHHIDVVAVHAAGAVAVDVEVHHIHLENLDRTHKLELLGIDYVVMWNVECEM